MRTPGNRWWWCQRVSMVVFGDNLGWVAVWEERTKSFSWPSFCQCWRENKGQFDRDLEGCALVWGILICAIIQGFILNGKHMYRSNFYFLYTLYFPLVVILVSPSVVHTYTAYRQSKGRAWTSTAEFLVPYCWFVGALWHHYLYRNITCHAVNAHVTRNTRDSKNLNFILDINASGSVKSLRSDVWVSCICDHVSRSAAIKYGRTASVGLICDVGPLRRNPTLQLDQCLFLL